MNIKMIASMMFLLSSSCTVESMANLFSIEEELPACAVAGCDSKPKIATGEGVIEADIPMCCIGDKYLETVMPILSVTKLKLCNISLANNPKPVLESLTYLIIQGDALTQLMLEDIANGCKNVRTLDVSECGDIAVELTAENLHVLFPRLTTLIKPGRQLCVFVPDAHEEGDIVVDVVGE